MAEEMKKQILLVVMKDRPGALQKVTGLIARRGYRVDSMTFNRVEGGQLIKLSALVHANESEAEQLRRQVAKIIDTLDVVVLGEDHKTAADMALIRISLGNSDSAGLLGLINGFEARIVGSTGKEITVRMADAPDRIDSFISLVPEERIVELSRTGITALKHK